MTQQLWVPGDTRTSLGGTALPRPRGKVRGLLSGLGQKPHPLKVGNKAKSHGGKKSQGKPTDVKRRSRENLVPFCAVGPRAPGVEHGELAQRGGTRSETGEGFVLADPCWAHSHREQNHSSHPEHGRAWAAPWIPHGLLCCQGDRQWHVQPPADQQDTVPAAQQPPPAPSCPKIQVLSRFPAQDEAQAAGAWHGR